MNPLLTRRPRHVRDARVAGAALLAGLALVAFAALLAGCGGSSASDTPAAGATPTAIQVLAKATRGDLTQSVMGAATVEKAGGKTVVVATIDAQNAALVAAGQTATVLFFSGSQSGMPVPQGSGMPQPGASGMPVPLGGQSGMPVPQGSGMPQPGASGMPQGGFPGGPGQGDRGGTAGTVTDVRANADGTAAATISVDELPANVDDEVDGLRADRGQGPRRRCRSSSQRRRSRAAAARRPCRSWRAARRRRAPSPLGEQSGAQTEVVSGLNEGENVVYTQAFQGFPGGGGQSGMPMPQQGGQTSGDQSGGSLQ